MRYWLRLQRQQDILSEKFEKNGDYQTTANEMLQEHEGMSISDIDSLNEEYMRKAEELESDGK